MLNRQRGTTRKSLVAMLLVGAVLLGAMLGVARHTDKGVSVSPRASSALAPASSPEEVGRVMRMNPSDQTALIDRVARKMGVRFEAGPDPTQAPGDENSARGLHLLGAIAPKHPRFVELTDSNIQVICRFVQEEMNLTVPASQRPGQIGMGVIQTHERVFDGELGFYTLLEPKSPSGDAIMWYDYTMFASPDVFALLWVHELNHALLIRSLMHDLGLSRQEMKSRMEQDPEMVRSIEEAAWKSTVVFYGFMAQSGGINIRRMQRPLIDLLFFDIVTDAAVAYNAGQEPWKIFVRAHTHYPSQAQ